MATYLINYPTLLSPPGLASCLPLCVMGRGRTRDDPEFSNNPASLWKSIYLMVSPPLRWSQGCLFPNLTNRIQQEKLPLKVKPSVTKACDVQIALKSCKNALKETNGKFVKEKKQGENGPSNNLIHIHSYLWKTDLLASPLCCFSVTCIRQFFLLDDAPGREALAGCLTSATAAPSGQQENGNSSYQCHPVRTRMPGLCHVGPNSQGFSKEGWESSVYHGWADNLQSA